MYQSPFDGFIKKQGFIQPEDQKKGVVVWKVDALHQRKEFSGSTVCVAGSFITPSFTCLRFRFFMLNLIDIVVFARLLQAVEKIVKSSDAGSVVCRETTEDGVQRSYFKEPAPSGNGIYIQYD